MLEEGQIPKDTKEHSNDDYFKSNSYIIMTLLWPVKLLKMQWGEVQKRTSGYNGSFLTANQSMFEEVEVANQL